MHELPKWALDYASVVGATANVLVALGLLFAWQQLQVYRRQVDLEHLRAQRERAVDLVQVWTRSADRKGAIARKFVEELSLEQAKCIAAQVPFEVDVEHRGYLEGIFSELPIETNAKFEMTVKHSSELRWVVVSYLNNLETVLLAWNYEIADKHLIEEEFRYLIKPSENHFILTKFRQALWDDPSGANPFPAIEKFVEKLAPAAPRLIAP